MNHEDRLQRMIEELQGMREQCEPKSRILGTSGTPTPCRHCEWIIDDLAKERAAQPPATDDVSGR